ncbi:MAG: hypothetical protein JWN44_5033 [Myxococcales bacterium]|nr:hypothetical protein [Myxococcales bacterium]
MAEELDDLAAALLTEAGWLRRVARSLVRNHDADDVAQEVWVRALGQRPDATTTLRGWLAEAMRRLAHTRARSDARRRDREQLLTGGDEDGNVAADRLLEKAELLRLIGQLVVELDEPYRSTMLLRYYEGLSAADIARRHEVPAGTVRWRVKQALETLRSRLDKRVDRGRAVRALAPIAGGGTMVPALKLAFVVAVVAGGVSAGVLHHHRSVATASATAAAAATAPSPKQTANDTLQRAQDAYVHGEYEQAIDLAHEALPDDPQKAWRVIGASSCFQHDADGAESAWSALDDHGKRFIEYVCKRNDVTLPNGAPVL